MAKAKKERTEPKFEPLPVIDTTDSAQVRGLIRDLVMAAAGEMVQAAIERAKDGHDQIIKYLFEIAGLYPELNPENPSDDFSLARHLCDRLGLPPAPEEEALSDTGQAEVLPPVHHTNGSGNGHALK
ncbi:MAG TPA: hypothetical protein VMT53_20845 [Terriglobales bacterium]|nr:hypothetical protein [Terriglobales bacterium]